MSDITIRGPYDKVLNILDRVGDSYYVIGFAGIDRDSVKLYLSTELSYMTKATSKQAETDFRTWFNDTSLLRFSGKFKEIYQITISLVEAGKFIRSLEASTKIINVVLSDTFCDQHDELLKELETKRKEGNSERRGRRVPKRAAK